MRLIKAILVDRCEEMRSARSVAQPITAASGVKVPESEAWSAVTGFPLQCRDVVSQEIRRYPMMPQRHIYSAVCAKSRSIARVKSLIKFSYQRQSSGLLLCSQLSSSSKGLLYFMCRFGDCHRLAEWFDNSSDIWCGTRTPSRPMQSSEWVKGGWTSRGGGGRGGGGGRTLRFPTVNWTQTLLHLLHRTSRSSALI